MTTSCKIIADSIYEGSRLTTMEVTCHRFVLAEFNTHRKFSRNSASSRAIPVEKQLEKIKNNPAFPIEWPCEQPGMQGGSLLEGDDLVQAKKLFEWMAHVTVANVEFYLETYGRNKETQLHKSLINRLLEPFMWHTIVVTSTEWENFFVQRCSLLAQPEIRVLAELMQLNLLGAEPTELKPREWHLPYISEIEKVAYIGFESQLIKASVARCARVSTEHQDGPKDLQKDIKLFDRLVSAEPPHWSPLEHVAQVDLDWEIQGNFGRPWNQLRHNMKALKQ